MERSLPIVGRTDSCRAPQPSVPRIVVWLQGITLAWMLAECGVSLYAASRDHSVALLVFGADSLVELLSAAVALISFLPAFPVTRERAARWAGFLLFALAGVVAIASVAALAEGLRPGASPAGMAITIAALIVMPGLAWLKRRTAKKIENRALAADAVQSATCAYLAGVTLLSLGVNAAFHIRWIDSAAALATIPILIVEARRALRGESCGCC
jgi:divalent metal cation (Fe/Co/Zn/Cd) transporter